MKRNWSFSNWNRARRFCALIALGITAAVPLKAQLESGDLIAICGDSITQQRLYSVMMEEYFLMCQPQPDLSAVQFGWSGERANGFANRIENDVLPFAPTVVTTCYGMNDGSYRPVSQEILDRYRRYTQDFVQQLKEAGVRVIVLGSPGVVDPAKYKRPNSTAEEYNQTLKELSLVAAEIAEEEGVIFADVYSVMMEGMTRAKEKFGAEFVVVPDGVHPGDNGHLLMAYAFLRALGCDGEIGAITVDYEAGTAKSDSAQRVISFENREIQLESTRYPFCFSTRGDHRGTYTMSQFIPFNEDLNQYRLVVKNAPARTRVTWGESSRDYSAEELAEGVNLAADFQSNPFSKPFSKVSAKIKEQQNFESRGIKQLLHSLIDWRKIAPEEQETYDKLESLILEKDRELHVAAQESVVPVRHSIRIEPAG